MEIITILCYPEVVSIQSITKIKNEVFITRLLSYGVNYFGFYIKYILREPIEYI